MESAGNWCTQGTQKAELNQQNPEMGYLEPILVMMFYYMEGKQNRPTV